MRKIPNEPQEAVPEEVYWELESMDTYGMGDEVEELIQSGNLTYDEIEDIMLGRHEDMYRD